MEPNIFGKKGWTPELMKSQKGKTFLITGATSGTGFEASKILASKGAKVVIWKPGSFDPLLFDKNSKELFLSQRA